MMPVKDADPDAQDLTEAFNTAMNAPAKPKEPQAPPEVDPDAPFGRADDGSPIAPHGLKKDGTPRLTAAGRRAKDDTPRTADAPASGQGAAKGTETAKDKPAAKDYTAPLSEFADALWFGGSALGKGGSAIPLVGKYIPERKVAAQAQVFRGFKANLVNAVNVAAQHNARAARFAASIETGDITWVLTCGFMVMPFLTMSAAIWKGDEALAASGLTVEALASQNDVLLDTYLAKVSEEMEKVAAQAAAEAQAEMNGQATAEQAQAAAEAML